MMPAVRSVTIGIEDWIGVECGADAIGGEAGDTLGRRVVVVRAAGAADAIGGEPTTWEAASWEARDLATQGTSFVELDGGVEIV